MTSSLMDNQEVLRVKKISGKKRRSRSSFSSSCSLVKENFELNQLRDGENPMVYALVEVLKNSEEPAKREKIPLNNRDLFLMMHKFMSSRREKTDRKILRPSLKRKHGLGYGESNLKILKDQRNFAVCESADRSLGLSDKTNLSCRSSNQSTNNRDRYRRRPAPQNEWKILDEEKEHSDLKILYNRHATERHESKVKRERNGSASKGTNTDIVQTPKVLEEVLRALNLNLDIGFNGRKSEGEQNSSENKKTHSPQASGFFVKEESFGRTPVRNFLLVPFIITNGGREEKWREIKNNSCESFVNEEPKCSNCSRTIKYKTQHRGIRTVKSHRSFTDLRRGTNPVNLGMGSSSGINIKCPTKNGIFNSDEKDRTSVELEGSREQDSIKEGRFLEEVKTLQTKLNAIIKDLETNNSLYCRRNCGNFRKDENWEEIDGARSTEDADSLSRRKLSRTENCGSAEILGSRKPSPVHDEAPSAQDFSVQVTITKSSSEKTVAVPSEFTLDKIEMLHKLNQFPSKSEIEPPTKRPRRRTLPPSKSSPLFRTNVEYRFVRIKRASSFEFDDKLIEATDFLNLMKLDLKFEGSRPGNGDKFEKESRPPEKEKFKAEFPSSDPATERTADVVIGKSGLNVEPEGEDKLVATDKPVGKIAKIKIIGSTTLSDKSRDSGIGKIKLELDETNTIKISSKLTRKLNTNISNSNSNSSDKAENNTSSNFDNNARNNSYVNNNIKDMDGSKKPSGIAKIEGNGKFAKREAPLKKAADASKQAKLLEKYPKTLGNTPDSDTSQSGLRTSKLKKPATPVRNVSKGKESVSDSGNKTSKAAQKMQPASIKNEEVQKLTLPEKTSSMEKSPSSAEKACELSDTCEKEKKAQSFVQSSSTVIEVTNSDESGKAAVQKPATPQCVELPATEESNQIPDKQSQAVKSIWALTKVILYKDGSQSFEVLEASSSPPGYHLNQNKKNDNVDNNECNADSHGIKPAILNSEKADANEDSDHNCFNSSKKSG